MVFIKYINFNCDEREPETKEIKIWTVICCVLLDHLSNAKQTRQEGSENKRDRKQTQNKLKNLIKRQTFGTKPSDWSWSRRRRTPGYKCHLTDVRIAPVFVTSCLTIRSWSLVTRRHTVRVFSSLVKTSRMLRWRKFANLSWTGGMNHLIIFFSSMVLFRAASLYKDLGYADYRASQTSCRAPTREGDSN